MNTLKFALTLLLELVPLFLAISVVVHLFVERLTPERIQALLGGRYARWLGVPLAAVAGALTPFCTCSGIPVIYGMRRAGVPTAPLVTFVLASPLLNPVAVVLLVTAVSAQFALLYTVSALAFAMLAGILLSFWYRTPLSVDLRLEGEEFACKHDSGRATCNCTASCAGGCQSPSCAAACAPTAPPAWRERLERAMRRAWKDLKQIALPLVIAVAVGAWIHDYVPASLLERLSGPGQWWAIPLAAVLGVPVYASVVVLLPLGTSLLAKGVGVGVVTAFLLGATGFSLPEGMILYKILPRPLLVRLVVVFTFGVISLGYLFQAIDHRGWLPNRARAAQPVAAISAGPHAAH